MPYLQLPVTAVEAHVIHSRVIQAQLVFLHLDLNATDSSIVTHLAPVSVLAPLHAGPLQHRVAAAAETDVVCSRVVPKKAAMGLHSELEGGENTGGAILRTGPLTKTGVEVKKRGEKN